MKKSLLSNTEAIAVFAMAALALITGGYNTLICAVVAGMLIGLSAHHDRAGIVRAAVLSLITGILIFIGGWIYMTYIAGLPGVDPQAADQMTIRPLVLAVITTVVSGTAMAAINAIHDDRKRKYGMLAFLAVCAIVFPFVDQCPTLAWTGPIKLTNPTVGCTTEKSLIWVNAAIVIFIYAIQAMGLNIVAGYAGLLDLGYVAFFAIGAYTAGLLNSNHLVTQGVTPGSLAFWLVLWLAAAAAAVFGLLLGSPVLPLRGDYLAIVTLGFGEIIPIAAKNLEDVRIFEPITLLLTQLGAATLALTDRMNNAVYYIQNSICIVGCNPQTPFNLTNGTKGISPIFPPELLGYKFATGEYVPWYFLALIIMAGTAFFISRIRVSRIGRAWVSMREDELAANSMGVNIFRTKILAFIVGAMFSGFAGGFYGSYVSFIDPGSFAFDISVTVLAMVILGGSGNIVGVLVGAFLIKGLDIVVLEKLKQFVNGIITQLFLTGVADNPALGAFFARLFDATSYKIMMLGLILVVMMKIRPQGLIPETTAATRRKRT